MSDSALHDEAQLLSSLADFHILFGDQQNMPHHATNNIAEGTYTSFDSSPSPARRYEDKLISLPSLASLGLKRPLPSPTDASLPQHRISSNPTLNIPRQGSKTPARSFSKTPLKNMEKNPHMANICANWEVSADELELIFTGDATPINRTGIPFVSMSEWTSNWTNHLRALSILTPGEPELAKHLILDQKRIHPSPKDYPGARGKDVKAAVDALKKDETLLERTRAAIARVTSPDLSFMEDLTNGGEYFPHGLEAADPSHSNHGSQSVSPAPEHDTPAWIYGPLPPVIETPGGSSSKAPAPGPQRPESPEQLPPDSPAGPSRAEKGKGRADDPGPADPPQPELGVKRRRNTEEAGDETIDKRPRVVASARGGGNPRNSPRLLNEGNAGHQGALVHTSPARRALAMTRAQHQIPEVEVDRTRTLAQNERLVLVLAQLNELDLAENMVVEGENMAVEGQRRVAIARRKLNMSEIQEEINRQKRMEQ